MKQLTAGSLFSGIGGIDLAFALAGFNILFQVEIDGFCQKVLAKHGPTYWPDAEIHADVHNVGRHNLPDIDVLFGGFPCQSVSDAGKREGISLGTKSGLWFEFERIVGEIRPRIVFLENVSAITGRDGIKVITGLTQMGYDCKWGVISAADAGAPHQRDRWFCVGHTNIIRYTEPQHPSELRDHSERDDSAGSCSGIHIIHEVIGNGEMGHAASQRCEERQIESIATQTAGQAAPERFSQDGLSLSRHVYQSRVGRTVDGVSARMDGHHLMNHQWPAKPNQPQYAHEAPRMAAGNKHTIDRIRALGNAVVPQCVYPQAALIAELLRRLQ